MDDKDEFVRRNWVSERDVWPTPDAEIGFLKHKVAYVMAAREATGLSALDLGCGSGYGAHLLAARAGRVVAADLDPAVIEFHGGKAVPENLEFVRLPADGPLPFPDGTFDVVISAHVIEHVPDVTAFLREIRRVLSEGGRAYLTTPNRRVRLLPLQKPWNPDHLREYTVSSFRRALGKVFPAPELRGVMAVPEIMAIRDLRSRQRPVQVYISRPISAVMRTLVPGPVRRAIRTLRRTRQRPVDVMSASGLGDASERGYPSRWRLDQFWIEGPSEGSLDHLAICRR